MQRSPRLIAGQRLAQQVSRPAAEQPLKATVGIDHDRPRRARRSQQPVHGFPPSRTAGRRPGPPPAVLQPTRARTRAPPPVRRRAGPSRVQRTDRTVARAAPTTIVSSASATAASARSSRLVGTDRQCRLVAAAHPAAGSPGKHDRVVAAHGTRGAHPPMADIGRGGCRKLGSLMPCPARLPRMAISQRAATSSSVAPARSGVRRSDSVRANRQSRT